MKRIALLWVVLAGMVLGAVTTTINKMPAAPCNGVLKAFTFTFPIPGTDTSQVKVLLRNTTTGVTPTLVPPTDSTVSAPNNDYSAGGTVTTVAAYAAGYTITILREVPQTQTATFAPSSTLRAKTLEGIYDKTVMQILDAGEKIQRAIVIPPADTASDTELPDAVARANRYLKFDGSGNVTTTTELTTGTVSFSAFGESMAGAEDAAAGMTLLGVSSYIQTLMDDTTSLEAMTTLNGMHVYNVRKYGATGDGATNDATAIQTVIDAVEALGGGIVYFPRGTYRISTGLVVNKSIWLIGESLADDAAAAAGSGVPLVTIQWLGAAAGDMLTAALLELLDDPDMWRPMGL
jgi:hypothetical protein